MSSFVGNVGQVRRGSLASPALVVAPLLLLAAACGSGVENANSRTSDSAALSSSRKSTDAGTQYSFQFFDPPGATRTVAQAINDLGSATGFYKDANSGRHGFVRSPNGTIKTFDPTGSMNTIPVGINDLGVVVGYFSDANGLQHGFVRKQNGTIAQVDLKIPAAVDTGLTSINNLGVMLGGYDTGDINTENPVLIRDGKLTFLGEAPGSAPMQTFAVGLNDFGLVSGSFNDVNGISHGFIMRGTSYTIVDFPGSAFTEVYSVNDLGQVVGDGDVDCGFVYDLSKNRFDPLPCVGVGSFAFGLNNLGQFAGLTFDADIPGQWHGYIATPVRADD
jgi:probable HAF family extracellular repeat protein